jgi:hypothetical protein
MELSELNDLLKGIRLERLIAGLLRYCSPRDPSHEEYPDLLPEYFRLLLNQFASC